jgi:bifunctional non-homologous end joining protein LigD
VALQLASLVDTTPSGTNWLYETKYDGYRILARLEAGQVALSTRGGGDFTARAPRVAQALAQLAVEDALLDGELVSPPRSKGDVRRRAGDFQALQNALRDGRSDRLVYYAFDLLFLSGRDLRPLPLIERKQLLATLLASNADPHLKYSEHVAGDGAAIFQKACQLGMEGVIAKRADARYLPGRSKAWLKVKCTGRQEFVVIGFTAPSGSRRHLGALLLATRDGAALRYAGKVGTGFSQSSLEELGRRLNQLRRKTPPLHPAPRGPEVRHAQWVEPELVAEIEFTEFTADGRLRHPSFQGLREDKSAREVERERPLPLA